MDGPPRSDLKLGFFDRDNTTQAIENLASVDRVTIFCGAGVSLDQGMPNWSELIDALLFSKVAKIAKGTATPSIEDIRKWTKYALVEFQESSVASIVDALYRWEFGDDKFKERRNNAILERLYPGVGTPRRFSAPSLAEDVLNLAVTLKAAGTHVEIVTTNYDDTIEWAALNRPTPNTAISANGFQIVPYAFNRPERLQPGEIPVVHIHGYIPAEGDRYDDTVVLSETDYAGWTSTSRLRDHLAALSSNSSMLFVGSSLRDANILSQIHLHPAGGRYERYALLPTQGEINRLPETLRVSWMELASLAELRGSEIGLVVLRPDFFGQIFQFLSEIQVRTTLRGDYTSYMDRLKQWSTEFYGNRHSDIAIRLKATVDAKVFVDQWLPKLPRVERAKIEIWVRGDACQSDQLTQRAIELWISSQAVLIPSSDYWPKRVPMVGFEATRKSALRAFATQSACTGRVVPPDPDRWTHYVAVPIITSTPAGRLPVGSVVMFMHSPTNLDRDRIPSVDSVIESLADALKELGIESIEA